MVIVHNELIIITAMKLNDWSLKLDFIILSELPGFSLVAIFC